MIRIAINGFGRIGRRVFRLIEDRTDIQVVVINDLADSKTLSHLLKYDSIHGVLKADIGSDPQHIIVNSQHIPLLNHPTLDTLDWSAYNVDIVIEATGKYKTELELQKHLAHGAQRVILSVPPSEDSIKTVVLGVNDEVIDGTETIISNASCTTNNAAPMIAEIGRAHV